jgi:hypothetical protein
MMPNVNISNSNFQRLQGLAVPLVDDLDSVLARVLDVYESHHGADTAPVVVAPDDLTVKTFPADAPPDLTYTSIKSIMLDGKVFNDRYWNPLLFAVVGLTTKKLGKDKMLSVLEGNYTPVETQGYKHIPEAGIHVQGRESNLCWRAIYKLLKAADIPVEVDFYWQDKPTAAFPGKNGRFVVEAK